MNFRMDLAGRILLLCSGTTPTMQQLLDLLSDYYVEPVDKLAQATFEKQIEYFLGAKRTEGLADRSIENYELYLRMFAGHVKKKIEDITSNDIREFISYMGAERGLKKTSLQAVINVLRSFFGWMVLEEVIFKNPMLKIKSFSIDKTAARHPLSTEELEILRDTCKDYREKALVEFLYSTGCRLSEITGIALTDVNFESRSVEVLGKGGKRRTVYFSVRARLMLRKYLKERKGGTALFTGCRHPYDALKEAAIQKILRELGRRSGLSRRIHPHILRHTFATDCLNAGMDITTIQALLGHASLGSTQIYIETNQVSVRREYDRFIA